MRTSLFAKTAYYYALTIAALLILHPLPAAAREVLSKTYVIDGLYRSMEGPQSTQKITLLDAGEPELLLVVEAVLRLTAAFRDPHDTEKPRRFRGRDLLV